MLYRFAGDTAELGIVRDGTSMKAKVILNPRVHLVCELSYLEIWYQSIP